MVEKFGDLLDFEFLYNRSGPQAGQPRGYAFVTFKTKEAAGIAQKTLNGIEVMGRKITVTWAKSPDEASYEKKGKKLPPGLSVAATQMSQPSGNKFSKLSKESKIAALEAKLKLLEGDSPKVNVVADVGANTSQPSSVTYSVLENKNSRRSSRLSSHPYVCHSQSQRK